MHRIEISGTEAVRSIELRDGKSDPMDCGYEMHRGGQARAVVLHVKDTEGHQTRARLDVDGPSRVTVAPGNDDARVAGGALFVVGLAAVAVGGSTMVAAFVGLGSTALAATAAVGNTTGASGSSPGESR